MMRQLELANLPDDVYEKLERAAKAHSRNIEQEAVARLTQSLSPSGTRRARDAAALLREARELRNATPSAWVTEEFLRSAREDGRA